MSSMSVVVIIFAVVIGCAIGIGVSAISDRRRARKEHRSHDKDSDFMDW
ncbi:hypothetical protein [Atopobium sp. oral taxon 416]|nr:hypothetical protein [Atopobium sp. oral taxon 416]QUC04422.1 hypothetical protein J4859_05685 [Atopobium sp. oral taxon 416]